LPERKVFQQQVAARTKTSRKGSNQEPQQAEHETSFTLEQTKLETKFIYLIRRQIDILARHTSWPWLPLVGFTAIETVIHIPAYAVVSACAIYSVWVDFGKVNTSYIR
jgi:hypothetical protein